MTFTFIKIEVFCKLCHNVENYYSFTQLLVLLKQININFDLFTENPEPVVEPTEQPERKTRNRAGNNFMYNLFVCFKTSY